MTIKRFYFVHGPRSSVPHMAEHVTEGTRTYCGIRITKLWKWLRFRRVTISGAQRRVCRKCRSAKP